MQLTIIGGGGFRVPLVYEALLRDARRTVTSIVLYDVHAARLEAIAGVLKQLAAGQANAPAVRTTTSLGEALRGADFVFSAIRVGGLEGRVADEQVPLDLGLVGQETTGPGGIAYGLRTVPVALRLAAEIATTCPDAWTINFTNPAGMITEAMQQVLGERVIGICDSPSGLAARATRALGLGAGQAEPAYVGLNHLGWLRRLSFEGADLLPRLLADEVALAKVEEAGLFGSEWLRELGAVPNEYLYYYYFTREAVAGIKGSPQTRGQFLLSQQSSFYAAAQQHPEGALDEWRRAQRERSASYLAELGAGERAPEDVDAGGYERVAMELMHALAHDEPTLLILNVRNGFSVPSLPADAVVEVPCRVDAAGPQVQPVDALPLHMSGLMQQVKAAEQLAITAATTGSFTAARAALALHPLVDSVATATVLLDAFCARIPGVAASVQRTTRSAGHAT